MIAISLGVQTFIFNPKEQKSFIPRRGCQKQRCVELKGGKKKRKKQASEDKWHSELWFMQQHRLELVLCEEWSGSNKQLRMNPEHACNFDGKSQSSIDMFICYSEHAEFVLDAAAWRASSLPLCL